MIEHESDLLVANERVFREQFAVDCRTGCEAIGISATEKTVELRNVATGEVTTESYDKLVLSPGAPSIRPPLPGIDLPGIFPVRTVPDAREIREWIERGTSFLAGMERYSGFQTVRPARHAVVVGGGFIGLETAENLVHRGFEVTVVELADQVLAPLDPEYGAHASTDFLEFHGVHVLLNDGVAGFEQSEDETLTVSTQSGKRLSGGHRDPRTWRASRYHACDDGRHRDRRARRDPRRRPDAHERPRHLRRRRRHRGEGFRHRRVEPDRARGTGEPAGPHRGRRDRRARLTLPRHPGHLRSSGCSAPRSPGQASNEKTLNRLGDTDFEKIYLYPNSHAGYYPGAKPIAMKVLFRKSDGRLLGAQALGEDGVDKRISELALAIQLGATVYDLEEVELCYSPPFGSAKDPVNFAGMVAAGVLRGDMPLIHWDIPRRRVPPRRARKDRTRRGARAGSGQHPSRQLRSRLDELPRDREILVICRSGQRAYYRDTHPRAERVQRPRHLRRDAVPRDHRGMRREALQEMPLQRLTASLVCVMRCEVPLSSYAEYRPVSDRRDPGL